MRSVSARAGCRRTDVCCTVSPAARAVHRAPRSAARRWLPKSARKTRVLPRALGSAAARGRAARRNKVRTALGRTRACWMCLYRSQKAMSRSSRDIAPGAKRACQLRQIFYSTGATEQIAKSAAERGEERGELPSPTWAFSARCAVHGELEIRGGTAQCSLPAKRPERSSTARSRCGASQLVRLAAAIIYHCLCAAGIAALNVVGMWPIQPA